MEEFYNQLNKNTEVDQFILNKISKKDDEELYYLFIKMHNIKYVIFEWIPRKRHSEDNMIILYKKVHDLIRILITKKLRRACGVFIKFYNTYIENLQIPDQYYNDFYYCHSIADSVYRLMYTRKQAIKFIEANEMYKSVLHKDLYKYNIIMTLLTHFIEPITKEFYMSILEYFEPDEVIITRLVVYNYMSNKPLRDRLYTYLQIYLCSKKFINSSRYIWIEACIQLAANARSDP